MSISNFSTDSTLLEKSSEKRNELAAMLLSIITFLCWIFATLQHVGLLSFNMWGYDVFSYTPGVI